MQVTIRDARPSDLDDYLRLLVELHVGDPPPTAEAWTRRILPALQIAEHDGRVGGLIWCEVLGVVGFVRQVITDPGTRRQGVGRRLMAAGAARLRAHGVERWQLNVKPDNVAARAMYASFGLHKQHDSVVLRLPWHAAPTLGDDLPVALIAAQRDAQLEPQLGLPTGLFASCRGRSASAVVLGCELDSTVHGLAAFDPHFGGAYPFRAQSAEVAASLVRAMYARRVPNGREGVGLVVEDDPTLATLLLGWGGVVTLQMCFYVGDLPGA